MAVLVALRGLEELGKEQGDTVSYLTDHKLKSSLAWWCWEPVCAVIWGRKYRSLVPNRHF